MASKQNIIYIYFKGKHLTISKSQYQYNHGQFLYFADLDLPQTFEVHFSNRDKGESKPQIGSNKLVEIPDEYFWSGALQIYAWIYLHSGADDGETVYEVKIPLMKRAKPTDEEPLPQQQGVIDRAIAELNNAIEITTENANKTNADKTIVNNIKDEVVVLKDEIDSTATTINQKAQEAIAASERAETSAQNAATSERKALDYAQQADQSAQSALESKNVAQQKADVATDASAEALGYRNEALEAKNQAVQAKQNIVDYRNETKEYRDETLNLKNNVQTLKNQIDETAEEIEDISDSVKEDAQSASRSASSANQSSINASQSASQAKKSADDAEESANQAEQNKNQTETFKNQSEEYKTQAETFKSQAETFKNQAEEFKNQTETNVTHYPKIIGDYWYIWDATNGEYINTNVDANGIKGDTGNGIASIALNDDYTLTITFTDDTTYTTSSIRGQQGEKGDTGATGESGVYIGTEEPENEDIKVWIDTDDDGTSEDLVKEIDGLKRNIYKPYVVDSASGSIASFSDGADDIPLKSLVVDINPVQNLNGYDSPWVAGGGKNKLFLTATTTTINGVTFTVNDDGTIVVKGTATADIVFEIWSKAQNGGNVLLPSGQYIVNGGANGGGTSTYRVGSNGFAWSGGTLKTETDSLTFTITENEAQTNIWIQVFNGTSLSNVVFKPMIRLASVTDASFAPYENICPISGWTGANMEQSGVNVWDEEAESGYFYTSNGVPASSNEAYRSKNYIPVKPNTTYFLKNDNHATNSKVVRFFFYDKNKTFIISPSGDTASRVFTVPDNAYFMRFYVLEGIENYTNTLSINYPSTDHSYHPYTGRSVIIDLGQTVYGGKLDVLSGVLTVDRAMADLGTLNCTSYSGHIFAFYVPQPLRKRANLEAVRLLCSALIVEPKALTITAINNMTFDHIAQRATFETSLWTRLNYDSADSVKSALAGTMVCYELAEPITYQLTPHEVRSLLGQNNIFADTGSTSIEYRADTKLYINKKITEAISTLT